MHKRNLLLNLTALAALTGPALGGAAEISSATDIAATIALNGMPCDHVVDVKRMGDSDYMASCKDGNRYHVFVNAQGRVVVQKQ